MDDFASSFLSLSLGLATFASSYAYEDYDFFFLGFFSHRFLGSLGFLTRSASLVFVSLFKTGPELYDGVFVLVKVGGDKSGKDWGCI